MKISQNNRISRNDRVDVKFEDLQFTTTKWHMKGLRIVKENKKILHKISGEFKSGELTAIMGPSGAGKTTLLNILAGYRTSGKEGNISINNQLWTNDSKFEKLIGYIPQDELLRPNLTVYEYMQIVADLKMGYSVSENYKDEKITEILKSLGIFNCLETLTNRLSGGQKKRLAIALELLSNPPVLFLDEPTTGLDSLTCRNCVSLLKKIANEGRTVICTIHQPSARIFDMFDKVYTLSDGKTIYDGHTSELLPYLSTFGLSCPAYHNPADFLIDVASGDYGVDLKLSLQAQSNVFRNNISNKVSDQFCDTDKIVDEYSDTSPARMLLQFSLLLQRNLLILKRNYQVLLKRVVAHFLISLISALYYMHIGNDASRVLNNYAYLFITLLLVTFTGTMSVTVTFPLEMKVLKREFYNRWYSLPPYILSVICVETPAQILCAWIYIPCAYFMTGQPMESQRFYYFVWFVTLSTICSQAWGYFIGSLTTIKIALFISPVIVCLLSVFGFCLRYDHTPFYFQWLYHLSYFRAGFHGVIYAVYDMERPPLICPDDTFHCVFSNPQKFLTFMGITDINLLNNSTIIVAETIILMCITYFTLRSRIKRH